MKQIHHGTVTRNVDETEGLSLRGAVYFKSPTLTGETEYSKPALPMFPYAAKNAGIFFVPDVDDVIEIEIDTSMSGNISPRYRCGVYSSEDDIDELFKINYPKRSGWVTKRGHYLIFDDTPKQEMIVLGHALLGTSITMDSIGNMIEDVVRDKVESILKDNNISIGGKQTLEVQKDRTINVGANELHKTEGNFIHEVNGDYILRVRGAFKPEYPIYEDNPKQITSKTVGFRDLKTGGGYKHSIGGSKAEAVGGNIEQTIAGNESKMVTFTSENVFGTGLKNTIALGNTEFIQTLGNFIVNIIAGNVELSSAAGNVNLSTLAGAVEIKNAISKLMLDVSGAIELSNILAGIKIDVAGNVTLSGLINKVGSGASGVLTHLNNPIIDNITGAPHIPSLVLLSD